MPSVDGSSIHFEDRSISQSSQLRVPRKNVERGCVGQAVCYRVGFKGVEGRTSNRRDLGCHVIVDVGDKLRRARVLFLASNVMAMGASHERKREGESNLFIQRGEYYMMREGTES